MNRNLIYVYTLYDIDTEQLRSKNHLVYRKTLFIYRN